MSLIQAVQARMILDSRGNPTVEAEISLQNGIQARAACPSGASTGSRESLELRDGQAQYYGGKSVDKAIQNVNQIIAPALIGKNVFDQAKLDHIMITLDATDNKSYLGANAILPVSLAIAHSAAQSKKQMLFEYLSEIEGQAPVMPVPMMNIINGGSHADNNIDIQEFMIIPSGAPSFKEALRYGVEIFQVLKKLLAKKKLSTAVGDEGGFAPNLPSNEAAILMILEAVEVAGYQAGRDIFIALDLASNELYHDGRYVLASENQSLTAQEWTDYLEKWVNRYPIISLEDAMAEQDWTGWKNLTDRLGKRIQLVGDDLFVTHTTLLQQGIENQAANAILIKLNQVGTVSETLAAIRLAKKNDYRTIVSHRSGETEDTSIADLAVGTRAGQIKTGSLCRTDRTAKYNQLLRIEEKLGKAAVYAGASAFD